MMSTSSIVVAKEGKEALNIQLICIEIKWPHLWEIPEITYKGDPSNALSMIPPQVLMIQDVWSWYICKFGSIGDRKIRDLYGK